MTRLRRLKRALLAQADQPRRNLNRLLGGAGLFFFGMALVYLAEHHLPASIHQELIALAGLLFAGIGGILAAFGYLGLSLLRILKLISDHDDSRTPPGH